MKPKTYEKPDNPFYPNSPLPPKDFSGRVDTIDKIWRNEITPVIEHSRTKYLWISGDRGIGKTSLADYLLNEAEATSNQNGLFCLKIDLSTVHDLDQLILKVLVSLIEKAKDNGPIANFLKESFQKYIEEVSASLEVPLLVSIKAGFKIKESALKDDLPLYKDNFVQFLESLVNKIKTKFGVCGVFLLFDEINGLARDPEFANFLKGLSDNLNHHASLLFAICGTEEKRLEIIDNHESTNRIFNIYVLEALSESEIEKYLRTKFDSINMHLGTGPSESTILKRIAKDSLGQPKILQIIASSVYQADDDGILSMEDYFNGLRDGREEIGRKFVFPIHKRIKSSEYKELIQTIVINHHDKTQRLFDNPDFSRQELIEILGKADKKQKIADNFISRMKDLGLIIEVSKGRYEFCDIYTRFYLAMYSIQDSIKTLKKKSQIKQGSRPF